MSTPATHIGVSINAMDYLGEALNALDNAMTAIKGAPRNVRTDLDALIEELKDLKEALPDLLFSEVEIEGSWCDDCPFCERDAGAAFVELTKECTAKRPWDCPGVLDVLG